MSVHAHMRSHHSNWYTAYFPMTNKVKWNYIFYTLSASSVSLFSLAANCIFLQMSYVPFAVFTFQSLEDWQKLLMYMLCAVCSVMSDSLWPHGLSPARLLGPWNSPGKNTGMDCHSLLQRNFPTQEVNPVLLHGRQILYRLSYRKVYFTVWAIGKSVHSFSSSIIFTILTIGLPSWC